MGGLRQIRFHGLGPTPLALASVRKQIKAWILIKISLMYLPGDFDYRVDLWSTGDSVNPDLDVVVDVRIGPHSWVGHGIGSNRDLALSRALQGAEIKRKNIEEFRLSG